MLRIIAGELGGRRLRAPGGQRTRPTAERVREALFSILGPPPAEAAALDLYAGSGALGIEALSRGIARAVFVEQDATAGRVLGANLRDLGLAERSVVLARPVRLCGELIAARGPFHWVFADPPYASDELPTLLALLRRDSVLTAEGLFVLERATKDADAFIDSLPGESLPGGAGLKLVDRRRYGDTSLLFFGPVGDNS